MPAMRRFCVLSILLVLAFSQRMRAQDKTQSDDVIRVRTELVQTDITVVDKRGRFVGGLSVDDFELRVDSKLQPVSFFEEVTAGSDDEEQQLTAARKGSVVKLKGTTTSGNDRGRVIFFFVDDVHLTSESLTRVRSLITHFVENKMTRRTESRSCRPADRSVSYSSSPTTKPSCARPSTGLTPNTILKQQPVACRSVKLTPRSFPITVIAVCLHT